MTEPIKPSEVKSIKPSEVVETFNELIQKYWNGEEAVIKQREAVDIICEKMNCNEKHLLDNKLLDIEQLYRDAGWRVEYHKPGYNENPFPNYFKFTK